MKVISSICQDPILRVSARSSFAVSNARHHLGFVEIGFSLHNTSGIEAMRPFICFPVAGLQFTACAGWAAGRFLSETGRRMIRFAPKSARPLAAGETAMPCAVRLPFARSRGGSLTVARGVEKRLSELPDLRVFVITGAGNFAPERSSIVVPVNDIGAAIRRGLPDIELQTNLARAG